MEHGTISEGAGIQDAVRESELREWQLWYLTLGLLALFGLGALAGFWVLLEVQSGDASSSPVAHPLLAGLAALTILFCAYILHARTSVARVKLLLHEMSGMATGNLEMSDCLDAIAQGIARTYRADFARILVVRTNEPAVELASTFSLDDNPPGPEKGYSHELEGLPILRRAAAAREPLVLEREDLGRMAANDPERLLLTGGLEKLGLVLVLPLRTPTRQVGLLVLGLTRSPWMRTARLRMMSSMTTVARHAGTVIEDAIRRRESIRDPLTGLYNRRHFKEKVRDEIARASRHDETMAVLLCDLDRFKQINDTRGHQVGDAVLRSVATTICGATRGTDLHFRWGGDEIVVILSKTSEEGVLVVAERIRQAIAVYAESSGFDLDASIGIALYPQHGTHEDELVRAADLAMYVAKKSGDKVRVGIDEYAIDEECVSFVYQPVVTVESGEVLGHEVFTRDPDGQLSPLELFKKYHAVGQLGRLKRVIFELQIRQARFAGVRCLFLNADMDFLKRMDPVPVPSNLEVVVEVSELDRNTDEEDRIHAFRKWRRAGYRFAIDDFGAGYVSLALLSKLKPDYIKLDRSSIVQAVESTKFAEFLRHLLRAASEYATRGIIAEGIENRAELDTAKSLGVDFAQGFLLGRPSRVPEGSAITAHENLETA